MSALPTTMTDREVLADTMLRPTLEQLLLAMGRFGAPSLMFTDGWVCSVHMHVRSAGGTYTIRSEFRLGTPMIAARQCAERILQHLDLQP